MTMSMHRKGGRRMSFRQLHELPYSKIIDQCTYMLHYCTALVSNLWNCSTNQVSLAAAAASALALSF